MQTSFIADSLNHPNTRQKVIAAQRSSEIAQIASSVVEPGSAELENRESWTTYNLHLGGENFHHFEILFRPEKNGSFFFPLQMIFWIEDFGVETLGVKEAVLVGVVELGHRLKTVPKEEMGCFTVLKSKPCIYIYLHTYSFNKHQAVKLSLDCICVSLRSVILLLYPLAV